MTGSRRPPHGIERIYEFVHDRVPAWSEPLDQILRGDAAHLSVVADGQIRTPVSGLSVVIVLLGVLYGLRAGSFAMIRTGGQAYMQMIASAVRLPLLFFLTLGRGRDSWA
jgi:hypothetical protein